MRRDCISLVLILFAIIFSIASVSFVNGQKKKEKEQAVKTDLPYVGCIVCQQLVGELLLLVESERKKTPYKKLNENQIVEILDNVCKDDEPSGEWLRRFDVSETKKGSEKVLELLQPGGVSKCGKECATLVKSCENLLDDEIDRDDLSGLLWRNELTKAELTEKVCVKLASRCKNGKLKYLPSRFKRIDYPFEAMADKELQMEQMMAKMKASGMGGMSMYSRDDMENMVSDEMMDMYGDEDGYIETTERASEAEGDEEDEASMKPKSRVEF